MGSLGASVNVMSVAEKWVVRYAELLGVPAPTEDEMRELLELAGVAAHTAERTAAPLATWLAGRAGIPAVQALALATRLAEELPT
jgi:hypothetical protein